MKTLFGIIILLFLFACKGYQLVPIKSNKVVVIKMVRIENDSTLIVKVKALDYPGSYFMKVKYKTELGDTLPAKHNIDYADCHWY